MLSRLPPCIPQCVLCIPALMLSLSISAQQVPALETMMTAEEREATGLDSLSGEELEALNDWLQQRGLLPSPAVTGPAVEAPAADNRVAEIPDVEPESSWGEREQVADVVSIIEGEFTGWDGETVFQLANGQVYQQRRPGRWKTRLVDPQVRVRKSFFGFELEVDGHSIGVSRLR